MKNKTENPACCPRCNEPLGPDDRCYNSKCEEYDPLSQYFDGPSEEDMKEDIRRLKERLDAERSDLDDEFVPDSEMINVWLENFFLSKGKTSPDQLTAEEIQEEIEEVDVAISNERLWAHSDPIHYENIANLDAYRTSLKEMLEDLEKRDVAVSTQEWRIVMVSEGGTKHHFMGGYKSEKEANAAAASYDWRYVDDNRFEWRLEVEEDVPSRDNP